MNRAILASAALGVAAIGTAYLVAPATVLHLYGIDLQSASEANLFRAAYGGLFLGFALLFGFGATNQALSRTAQIALLTFMGGGAVGRLVSTSVDGWPHPLIVALLGVECTYACAAALSLRASTKPAAAK